MYWYCQRFQQNNQVEDFSNRSKIMERFYENLYLIYLLAISKLEGSVKADESEAWLAVAGLAMPKPFVPSWNSLPGHNQVLLT